jgi:hypothetical protein
LTVLSQYIYSLMTFFIGNQENLQTNSSLHSINTRNKHHLHRPIANLSCFRRGTSYPGIRIFNGLPLSITSLKNEKTQFRIALRKFLNAHSFYSVDEFFTCTDLYDCVNVYNILDCNILYMFVCLWRVSHPIVLWQSQGSMECIYLCMYGFTSKIFSCKSEFTLTSRPGSTAKNQTTLFMEQQQFKLRYLLLKPLAVQPLQWEREELV